MLNFTSYKTYVIPVDNNNDKNITEEEKVNKLIENFNNIIDSNMKNIFHSTQYTG